MRYFIERIYDNLLLVGVFERLASWDWPIVVVPQTTAGWRKAPALAQRVCTRGLASDQFDLAQEHDEHQGFRVVRAAGA